MSYVEIDFDDKVYALILLAFLPNSWEPMRSVVSNLVDSAKLKFNDVRNMVLTKEVCRIDLDEASTLSSSLNLESRGRGNDKNSN